MRGPAIDMTVAAGRAGLSARLKAQRDEGQRIQESLERQNDFSRKQNELERFGRCPVHVHEVRGRCPKCGEASA